MANLVPFLAVGPFRFATVAERERIKMQQFDKFIILSWEELLWKSGPDKMEVVLVDLEREATGTKPCKHTLPSWWQTVDIHV